MPWKVIQKGDSQWCVYKLGEDDEPEGEALACHDSQEKAQEQLRALYANEPKDVKFAVKFVDDEKTDLLGLLAPYGGPFNGRDLDGEFFSERTDFALDWFEERPLLYHHGMDAKVGISVVGRIKSLAPDALGLWMNAQLEKSHEYYEAIAKLVDQGKLFLSSGSLNHLVEINRKSGEIIRWPIVEGSMTPSPSNPKAELGFSAVKAHFDEIGVEFPEREDGFPKVEVEPATTVIFNATTHSWTESPDGGSVIITIKGHTSEDSMRKMIAQSAKMLEVDLSDDDVKNILEAVADKADDDNDKLIAAISSQVKQYQRRSKKVASWEDVRNQVEMACRKQLEWANPFTEEAWCYVEKTYSDHALVCVYRNAEEHHFKIPFTLNEEGNVASLGMAEEVEYVPVPIGQKMPMSMGAMTETTKAYLAELTERTKDLHERRGKEGRVISTANRRKLQDCLDGMAGAAEVIGALLNDSEPKVKADEALGRARALQLQLAVSAYVS